MYMTDGWLLPLDSAPSDEANEADWYGPAAAPCVPASMDMAAREGGAVVYVGRTPALEGDTPDTALDGDASSVSAALAGGE